MLLSFALITFTSCEGDEVAPNMTITVDKTTASAGDILTIDLFTDDDYSVINTATFIIFVDGNSDNLLEKNWTSEVDETVTFTIPNTVSTGDILKLEFTSWDAADLSTFKSKSVSIQ